METRPDLADTDTPGRRFVKRVGARAVVPVKLDQEAPILVDVDLLVLLANDLRRLRADNARLRCPERHPIRDGETGKLIAPRVVSVGGALPPAFRRVGLVAVRVMATQNEVIVILGIAVLRSSLDGISGGQRGGVSACCAAILEWTLRFLHHFRQPVSKALVFISSRELINASTGGRGWLGCLSGGIGVRLSVIVVVDFKDSRDNPLLPAPVVEQLDVVRPGKGGRQIKDGTRRRQEFMIDRVGEDQAMLTGRIAIAFVEPEIVVDSVLFHHPESEVQRRLPILDRVFERWVVLLHEVDDRAIFIFAESIFDNVFDVHIGEDPAIGPERHEPGPRPKHELINLEVKAGSRPLHLGQNSTEVAPRMIGRFQMDAAGFTERRLKIDVGVGAESFDVVFEQLANRLSPFEACEAQFVLAKRRRQFADPPVLGWSVSHSALYLSRRSLRPKRTSPPADAAADPRARRDRLALKIYLAAQYIHFWSASASRVTPPLLGAAAKALSAGSRFRSSREVGQSTLFAGHKM